MRHPAFCRTLKKHTKAEVFFVGNSIPGEIPIGLKSPRKWRNPRDSSKPPLMKGICGNEAAHLMPELVKIFAKLGKAYENYFGTCAV